MIYGRRIGFRHFYDAVRRHLAQMKTVIQITWNGEDKIQHYARQTAKVVHE